MEEEKKPCVQKRSHPTDCWYFDKEKVCNSPSFRDGIEHVKELSYRQQCANFIQDIGQRLNVTQLTINTAIVYMHRFYMFHSFKLFHRNVMAPCFIFLSAKIEEPLRKLLHVLQAAHYCLHKHSHGTTAAMEHLNAKGDEYMRQSAELVNNESILLMTLGFELSVEHPNTYVVKCAQLVRANKDLAQTAYFLATNSLHLTQFCVLYKPTVVACVCIYIACMWANYTIPDVDDKKKWFELIDNSITSEQLEEISSKFITIIDQGPSRLKTQLAAGPVVLKDGKVITNNSSASASAAERPSASNHSSTLSRPSTVGAVKAPVEPKPSISSSEGHLHRSQLTNNLKAHSHEATPPPQSWPSAQKRSHTGALKPSKLAAGVLDSSAAKHRLTESATKAKHVKVTKEVYEAMSKEQQKEYYEQHTKEKQRAKHQEGPSAGHSTGMYSAAKRSRVEIPPPPPLPGPR